VACIVLLVAVVIAIAVWTARKPKHEAFAAAVTAGPDPTISVFADSTCSPACCAGPAGKCKHGAQCSNFGCSTGCVCLGRKDVRAMS
jgi:hypothetical protein